VSIELSKEINVNILRFEMNVPTEVALQSSEGVSVEGRYGARTMFNLADGRLMYVPPIVANKIEAAGIVAGERFHLCKATVKIGQRRSVEWLVERAGPEQPAALREGSRTDPESVMEHDLRMSVDMANAKKARLEAIPAKCTCIDDAQTFAPNKNGHIVSNGNGALSPTESSPPVTKLEHALKTAISAAHNAEKFGSELGYVVRFDADAIKSMAITVLINMSDRVAR
jgi:hypothetical protein